MGYALSERCTFPTMNRQKIEKMKRPTIWIALALALAGCGTGWQQANEGGDSNWHLFRGNSSLSGYTDTRLPDKPTLRWSFKGGVRTVSSPVVDGGTTYWCDNRGRVLGIGIDGRQVFEYDMQTAVEATPMIQDSTLYIGRIDGFMTAISLSSRDTLWTYETLGQISASPNSASFEGRDAIVFGSYDNYLYSVDSRSGRAINRFESGYYLNGAVALWNNHVLFGGCDAWLRMIDCQTGVQTDSLLLDAYVPASPAIMGNYAYVGDYSGNVYELYLEGGKIARQKKIVKATSDDGAFISVPSISEKTLYILSDDRHLYAIDRRTGDVDWKFMQKGNAGESSPVVCRDRVIVCTKTGIISILDAATGRLEWEYDTGEQIVGSPAVIKDCFFILTTKGTLFCFGEEEVA